MRASGTDAASRRASSGSAGERDHGTSTMPMARRPTPPRVIATATSSMRSVPSVAISPESTARARSATSVATAERSALATTSAPTDTWSGAATSWKPVPTLVTTWWRTRTSARWAAGRTSRPVGA